MLLMYRYNITTKKPVGSIAGIQRDEDGPIDWGYNFPHSCQLSQYVVRVCVCACAVVRDYTIFLSVTMSIKGHFLLCLGWETGHT